MDAVTESDLLQAIIDAQSGGVAFHRGDQAFAALELFGVAQKNGLPPLRTVEVAKAKGWSVTTASEVLRHLCVEEKISVTTVVIVNRAGRSQTVPAYTLNEEK